MYLDESVESVGIRDLLHVLPKTFPLAQFSLQNENQIHTHKKKGKEEEEIQEERA
jgi:hypothetical protein